MVGQPTNNSTWETKAGSHKLDLVPKNLFKRRLKEKNLHEKFTHESTTLAILQPNI